MQKLKVLIADSHEVVRLGISFIVKCTEDFEVAGEAGTSTELISKAEKLCPDIVIMDSHLGEGNAFEACRMIKENHSEAKVVMLISSTDDDHIFEAISAGADALLPKQIKSDELTGAIRMVNAGKSMLDPSITTKVMNRVKHGFPNPERKEILLNPQERRILALIAEGKTNKEIAQVLLLSNNTIKNYVSGILSKLNFSNRAEAAAYAVRNNLMKPPRYVNEGHGQ
ncbi:MAG: response regulator transcription factor [Thermincola sp.]|jgi:DNA-binding NarL/FixJ family response regulator|nr:response regulator transcription factor [Thermincola sp.]MDT3704037.1 response regulator transcription factor [Thermincola sp.]